MKERACHFMLTKRRFWKDEQRWNADFEGSTFQGREYSIWATSHWKANRKSALHRLFLPPKSTFGEPKCSERNKRDVDSLSNPVLFVPMSGTARKRIELSSPQWPLMLSSSHAHHEVIITLWLEVYAPPKKKNLDGRAQTKILKGRKNFTPPKRRFGKDEQKMKCDFSKHFSRAWVLDLGHEQLKVHSTIRISSFVDPSKIFVWGAYKLVPLF